NILELKDSLNYIDEIWAYLEGINLLDKPLIDINAVRNFVFRMQSKYDQGLRKLWSEKEFNYIERFIHMHKQCGLYVMLRVGELEKKEEKPDFVFIKAVK